MGPTFFIRKIERQDSFDFGSSVQLRFVQSGPDGGATRVRVCREARTRVKSCCWPSGLGLMAPKVGEDLFVFSLEKTV